ncbi:MAG: AmmeMemoRadiSam system protein A [Candidatus Bipolaricaulota bacterium]|nr:AmmeMemoRadiSam system protein A [Candidatus Bipolaricaulota bacterium]
MAILGKSGGEMTDVAKLVVIAALLALATMMAANMMNTQREQGAERLSLDEQRLVLGMARARLRQAATGEPAPEIPAGDLSPALKGDAACFVTLTKKGVLRGCILDSFAPHESLYKNILRNVVLAATGDPRFPPVRPSEVDGITIEISVLDHPRVLTFSDPDDLVSKLVPGQDGVILTTRYGKSTYLPQVWDDLPDPVKFLSSLCQKQGAPADCWRSDSTIKIEIYHVFHFSEEPN